METIGGSVEQELLKTYKSAVKALCDVHNDEITKINTNLDAGKIFTIGCSISALASYVINQNAWYPMTFIAGGIASLIIYIVNYKRKTDLIEKISDEALQGVNNYLAHNLTGLVTKEELITFLQGMKMDEVFGLRKLPNYELSDYDKCVLLKEFALEVSYPGFEDDLTILSSIMDCLSRAHNANENYDEEISFMETTMLDKAYRFYTGDIAR